MEENIIFNTGETLNELRNEYNREGSLKRQVQMRLLDMLLYLDKVCNNINVGYRLDSGNVLGAVRHGGFIPWDDDVDVVIENRHDYKKLCCYLKSHPHPQYVLQDDSTDKGHIKYWFTLRDLNSEYIHLDEGENILDQKLRYRGLQIDVFPFKSGVIPSLYFKYAEWNKKEKYAILENKTLKLKIFRSFRKNICNPLLNLASKLFGNKNIYMYAYGLPFKCRIPKDVLFPHRPIVFEGYEFPGPANPHKYCEIVYGNYMDLPSKESRDRHMVTYKIW